MKKAILAIAVLTLLLIIFCAVPFFLPDPKPIEVQQARAVVGGTKIEPPNIEQLIELWNAAENPTKGNSESNQEKNTLDTHIRREINRFFGINDSDSLAKAIDIATRTRKYTDSQFVYLLDDPRLRLIVLSNLFVHEASVWKEWSGAHKELKLASLLRGANKLREERSKNAFKPGGLPDGLEVRFVPLSPISPDALPPNSLTAGKVEIVWKGKEGRAIQLTTKPTGTISFLDDDKGKFVSNSFACEPNELPFLVPSLDDAYQSRWITAIVNRFSTKNLTLEKGEFKLELGFELNNASTERKSYPLSIQDGTLRLKECQKILEEFQKSSFVQSKLQQRISALPSMLFKKGVNFEPVDNSLSFRAKNADFLCLELDEQNFDFQLAEYTLSSEQAKDFIDIEKLKLVPQLKSLQLQMEEGLDFRVIHDNIEFRYAKGDFTSGWMQIKQAQSGEIEIESKQDREIVSYDNNQYTGTFSLAQGSWELFPDKYSSTPIATLKDNGLEFDNSKLVEYLKTRLPKSDISIEQEKFAVADLPVSLAFRNGELDIASLVSQGLNRPASLDATLINKLLDEVRKIIPVNGSNLQIQPVEGRFVARWEGKQLKISSDFLLTLDTTEMAQLAVTGRWDHERQIVTEVKVDGTASSELLKFFDLDVGPFAVKPEKLVFQNDKLILRLQVSITSDLLCADFTGSTPIDIPFSFDLFENTKRRNLLTGAIQKWINEKRRTCTYQNFEFELDELPSPPRNSELSFQVKLSNGQNEVTLIGELTSDSATGSDVVRVTLADVKIQADSCEVVNELLKGMIFVWDKRQLRLDQKAYEEKLKTIPAEKLKEAWDCLSKKFGIEAMVSEKLTKLGLGDTFSDFKLNHLSILPFDFEVTWTATSSGVSLPITYSKSKQFSFGSLTIAYPGNLCQQIFDYLIKPHIDVDSLEPYTWESINQVLSTKKIPSLPMMDKLPVRPKDFYSDGVTIGKEGIEFTGNQPRLYFNAEIDFNGSTYELFTPENTHQRAFRINQNSNLEISSFAKLRLIDNGNGRSLFSGLEALDDCLVAEWKIETDEKREWIIPDKITRCSIRMSLSSHGLQRFLKSSVFGFLPEDAVKSANVKLKDGTLAKLGDGIWTFEDAPKGVLTQLYLGTVNFDLTGGSPDVNRNGIESIELELNDEAFQIGIATIEKLSVKCEEGNWIADANGKLKLSSFCGTATDVAVELKNIGILPRLDWSTAKFSENGLSESLKNCAILDLSWISPPSGQATVTITPTFSSLGRLDLRVTGKTSFFETQLDFDFEFGIRRAPNGKIELVNKDGLPLDETLVRTLALSQVAMKLKELCPYNLGSELSLDLVNIDLAKVKKPSAIFRVVSSKFELDETLKVSFPIEPKELSQQLGGIVQRKLEPYIAQAITKTIGDMKLLESFGVMNAELSIQPVNEQPLIRFENNRIILSAQVGLLAGDMLTDNTGDEPPKWDTSSYPGRREIGLNPSKYFLPIFAFDGEKLTWVGGAKDWWTEKLKDILLPDCIEISDRLWAVNKDSKWSIVGQWENGEFKIIEQSAAEKLADNAMVADGVFRLSGIQFRGSITKCGGDIFKAVVSAEKCQNAQFILMSILPVKYRDFLKDLKVDFEENHFRISGQLTLPGIGDYRFRNLSIPLKASKEELIKALLLALLESWQGESGGGQIRVADDLALRFDTTEMTNFLYTAFLGKDSENSKTAVELQTAIDGSEIRVKATLEYANSKFNIKIDEENLKKQLATLGIQRLLDGLNGLSGDSGPLKHEHKFVTNQHGTLIAVEIDVSAEIKGVGKLEIKGTRIGKPSRGPTYAKLTVSAPIPIPPALVIYDPSVTIDLSKKEEPLMKVAGKLTSPEETTGKIVHFAGEVSITLNKAFTIKNTGNLVLADRFSVATTTGTISPSVGELEQRLETNKPMSEVLDIRGHLEAKISKNLGFDAESEMTTRLLKKDLNSTILRASTSAGTFEFHNRIDLKIAKSDLLLKFEDGDFLATTHLEVGVKAINIGCDVTIRRSGVQVEATVTGVPIRLSFQDLDDLDDNLGKLLEKLTDPKFGDLKNLLKKGSKKKGTNESQPESGSKPKDDTPPTPPSETAPSTRPPHPSDALPFPAGSNAEMAGWPVKLTEEDSRKVVWTKPADKPNADWTKLGAITDICPSQSSTNWQSGYAVPMQNTKWQIMLMLQTGANADTMTSFVGESGEQITMREVSKEGKVADCSAAGTEYVLKPIVELSEDKANIRVIIADQVWNIPTQVKLPVIPTEEAREYINSLSLPILDISDYCEKNKDAFYDLNRSQNGWHLVIPKSVKEGSVEEDNTILRGMVFNLEKDAQPKLVSLPSLRKAGAQDLDYIFECRSWNDHQYKFVLVGESSDGKPIRKDYWEALKTPEFFPYVTRKSKESNILEIRELDLGSLPTASQLQEISSD